MIILLLPHNSAPGRMLRANWLAPTKWSTTIEHQRYFIGHIALLNRQKSGKDDLLKPAFTYIHQDNGTKSLQM